MPPDSTFDFTITGFPSIVMDADGNRIQQRDDVTELLIGAIVLIIVAAVVSITAYSWSQQPAAEPDKVALVRRIAALDLAYEEKTVTKRAWQQKRQDLLKQLKAIWS